MRKLLFIALTALAAAAVHAETPTQSLEPKKTTVKVADTPEITALDNVTNTAREVTSKGSTTIEVSVMRNGRQYFGGWDMFVPDGGVATTGEYSEYPVAIEHLDGKPFSASEETAADFAGSWQIEIKKITFDASGNGSIMASLDEHAPGSPPMHHDVTLTVKAGEHTAMIHGTNGSGYVLTVHHLSDPAG